ncbi:MAG: hypothetical protein IH851_05740 [Armatimonadetes bacterium]|nr:hypothetical protein [Armatimonadota bacterium]
METESEQQAGKGAPAQPRWWKGNLHTHTFWSDGDNYPEVVVDWYKSHGYNFLALSDHNVLSEGDRWLDTSSGRGTGDALRQYRERFGDDWVEIRQQDGKTLIRLKPLNEFRKLFEDGRFLLIQSEEISDSVEGKPVHLNATNLKEVIPPQGGKTVLEAMQNNVNAVLEQRARTGQPMFPHLNHPNFGWAVTAEDLIKLKGEQFFEVYNGHPAVRNHGDRHHAGAERMWDIILTKRLAELGGEVMFGIAVDDAHNYLQYRSDRANPGRGWVVVRAPLLTPNSIIAAMERGDFYASSGVVLRDIRFDGKRLSIEIEPEPGVAYHTMFIGTRRGYDTTSRPIRNDDGGPLAVTREYSAEIGETLAVVAGLSPSYALKGDEVYVRAKVISSKVKENPYSEGEVEVAWVQPVIPETPYRQRGSAPAK